MWEVEVTDEYEAWFNSLDDAQQDSVRVSIAILEEVGPSLGRPHVDSLQGSKTENLKELRTQHKGRPIRSLFAFDPRRTAILLIGGDKTGDKRFYERTIAMADRLYQEHIAQLRKEGLI